MKNISAIFFAILISMGGGFCFSGEVLSSFNPVDGSDDLPVFLKKTTREKSDDFFTKYTYSVTQGSDAIFPWVLTSDGDSHIWVTGEFGRTLHEISRGVMPQSSQATTAINIPIYFYGSESSNAPFGMIFSSPLQTTASSSEQITVDSQGRVWFPQTGGLRLEKDGEFNQENNGVYPIKANYSRIVRYDPATEGFCIYNVPDKFSSVLGVTFQPGVNNGDGLIWFSQAGRDSGVASIVSMDPGMSCDSINYEWELDSNGDVPTGKAFAHDYCTSNQSSNCYKKYSLPSGFSEGAPSMLAVYEPPNSGEPEIWFALSDSNAIGRFFTSQESFKVYKVGKSPYQFNWEVGLNGGSVTISTLPWDIAVNPDNGDIYFSEYVGAVIGKIDRNKINASAACESINFDGSSGINPCMQEMQIPKATRGAHQAHHIKLDEYGNLWFDVSTDGCRVGENYPASTKNHYPASIGVINASFSKIYLFDHLWSGSSDSDDEDVNERLDPSGRLVCESSDDNGWNYTGLEITSEPISGGSSTRQTIWVVDSFLKKIRRLEFKSSGNIICALDSSASECN